MTSGKICIPCQVEYRCKRNGVLLVSMGTQGILEAFESDVYECPGCGHQMVGGIGSQPTAVGEAAVLHEIEMTADQVVRFWLNNKERDDFLAKYGQDHPALSQDLVT